MKQGVIKIKRGDVTQLSAEYQTKHHRQTIITEWAKLYGMEIINMAIHILPRPDPRHLNSGRKKKVLSFKINT